MIAALGLLLLFALQGQNVARAVTPPGGLPLPLGRPGLPPPVSMPQPSLISTLAEAALLGKGIDQIVLALALLRVPRTFRH